MPSACGTWWRAVVVGVLGVLLVPPTVAGAAVRARAVSAPSDRRTRPASAWSFPATGYFTTAKRHGRWFFVTPTGQPFFSTGVDHVDSDSDTDQTTGQCPYCEAIQSQYPSTAAWATATVAQLRSWGFNSLGPFSDDGEFAGQMPYSVQLNMASGDDWFAPSFVANADEVAATQVAPLAEDPNLIGWYTDSELTWGPNINNSNSELDDYLALPAGSPGLAVARRYNGHPSQFLYALATRYFQVTTHAIRMYDPHHLILGVKAEGQYVPRQLLEAAGRSINVFSIDDYTLQPGFARAIRESWRQYLPVTATFGNFEHYAQIPIMVAEYSFIGETAQTPDTVPGVYATYPTQQARALAYTDYIAPLYENAPWVVGDEWFEDVDEPQGGRVADGENNNFGLVDVENQPYQDLVTQMTIMHSVAPDRVVQTGATCDAWTRTGDGVVCTATMPRATFPLQGFGMTVTTGTVGQSYQGYVVAAGGTPHYTFAVADGSLPPGLHLDGATGKIMGTPKESGTFDAAVVIADAASPTPHRITQAISLQVAPKPPRY